jgi:hypothetical protein
MYTNACINDIVCSCLPCRGCSRPLTTISPVKIEPRAAAAPMHKHVGLSPRPSARRFFAVQTQPTVLLQPHRPLAFVGENFRAGCAGCHGARDAWLSEFTRTTLVQNNAGAEDETLKPRRARPRAGGCWCAPMAGCSGRPLTRRRCAGTVPGADTPSAGSRATRGERG